MKDPWTRKNPLLSMWLSGVNTVAGTIRGHAIAEGRRQMRKSTKQMASFWGAALAAPPKKKKRKAR